MKKQSIALLISLFCMCFLLSSSALIGATLLFNDFNNKALTNLTGGAIGAQGAEYGLITFVSNNNAYGNSGYSLAYNFNVIGSGASILNMYLGPAVMDLTQYDYLSFFIKGQNGEKSVRFKSHQVILVATIRNLI